ncbi:RasGEF domain-containing protein [Cavenderia fasciculata]|uniref:RasGEF domain-containing protein n=1 Tax=Cavenderia fasciculata TaxID=261658 RepID=F4PNH4_CACFS|nr:RasGEF domain-containing protein [Cavenderia fasciculata]EGG23027.1 RasGEF domain-containing protein [Cavenderia fasciculata]|eukprot:XP_004360878.1 RasGEF domain-containing protein [Cavenderia fasciculata]
MDIIVLTYFLFNPIKIMAEVTEGFSALSFWKNVEKKNISTSFKESPGRSAPKKLNFPLLKPPAPEDEASTSVLVKSEWDDQNVTGAFDFWKKKAIEVKEETERYNTRRSYRNTVDLTNILAKSSSDQNLSEKGGDSPKSLDSLSSGGGGSGSSSGSSLSPLITVSPTSNININASPETSPIGDAEQRTGAVSDQLVVDDTNMVRSFRRSRSISCEAIPQVATSTTSTSTTSTVVQPTASTDKQEQDVEESSSSDEESDLSSEESYDESSDDEMDKLHEHEPATPPNADSSSSPVLTSTPADHHDHLSSIQSISQVQEESTYKLDVQSAAVSHPHHDTATPSQPSSTVHTTTTATTPMNIPDQATQQKQQTSSSSAAYLTPHSGSGNNSLSSSPLSSSPLGKDGRPKKDAGKRSIGATLTRTMTKTFGKDANGKPTTSSGSGSSPNSSLNNVQQVLQQQQQQPSNTPKKEKVKLDKQEKERRKQEKRELKKKEREQKKQSKKKNLTKSLSLTDMSKKAITVPESSSVFKVRLTKLVANNNGNLPPFITSAITFLSNSENVDVSYIFMDAHNDPTVKSLRVKAEKEEIDFSTIPNPRIVGGLLRTFFGDLPQPLFNTKFYDDLMEIQDITKPEVKLHDLRSLIWTLSHLRRNLLLLLVTFLMQKYVNSSPTKQATVGILASTFGPVLFRSADPKTASINQIQREETMRLILENNEFLFDQVEKSDLVYANHEGKMIVAEASVDSLVDRATDVYYHFADKYFMLTFFMTHHYFIQPNDLADKLIQLHRESNRAESKKKWKKNRGGKRAEKINEAVKLWVDYCYRELREDKKLAQKILKGFPHLEAQLSSRLTQSRFAFSDILKVPKFHTRTRSASVSDSLLFSGAMSKDPSLVAMEIAEQATVADYDLFVNVRLSDWVRLLQGSVDPTQCPYLANALKKSTTWCQWAMGEIMQVEDKGQRVQVICLLVEIAVYCRELSNYNTCISILNAFNNHHIKRLTQTWEAVPAETRAKITRLSQALAVWTANTTSASGGATQFAQICAQISSACVPHFGTLRAVLQSFDQSMPTKSSDGLRVNVDKLRHVFSAVVDLQRLQQRQYTLKPSKLSIHLQDLQAPTMEELAEMSLVCEPPTTTKKYTAPVDASVAVPDWREQIAKSYAKPVAQTAVGIDLPRLACFFTIGGRPTVTGAGKVADIQANIAALSRLVLGDAAAAEANFESKMSDTLPLTTPPDSDIKRELVKYLDETVGADHPIVSLLKCCNQAIIAPAVIELTLNIAKGIQFMDAAGSWRIEINSNIIKKENNSSSDETNNNENNNENSSNSNNDQTTTYIVRHIKRQKSRSTEAKDHFEFEWSLTLTLDSSCKTIQSFSINIISINFYSDTNPQLKEQITQTLTPYLLTTDCIKEISQAVPAAAPPSSSDV